MINVSKNNREIYDESISTNVKFIWKKVFYNIIYNLANRRFFLLIEGYLYNYVDVNIVLDYEKEKNWIKQID